MQFIKRVTSLESPGFSPAHRDQVTINGRLMRYLEGAFFEYGSRTDGASGLWVPEDFHDSYVQAVYKAGTAYTSSPNSDWNWSWTNLTTSGTISEPDGDTTLIDCPGGADKSYLRLEPGTWDLASDHLGMFARWKCTDGDDDGPRVQLYADGSGNQFDLNTRLAANGTPGDIEDVNNAPNLIASFGSSEYTALWWELADHAVTIWHYDTQTPLVSCPADSADTSGAGRIRLGSSLAEECSLYLSGFPAIAFLIARS